MKTFKEKEFLHPLISWGIIFFWYFIFVGGIFAPAALKTQDFFTSQSFLMFSRIPHQSKQIVIVAIDEPSRYHLNLMWPWKRSVTADLVRTIASYHPKVIGLDIIFSGVSEEKEDQALVSALGTHPRIVLACRLLEDGGKELPFKKARGVVYTTGFVNKPEGGGEGINIRNLASDKVVRGVRNYHVSKERPIDYSMDIEILTAYLDVPHTDIKVDFEKGIYLGDKAFIPSKGAVLPLNYLVHANEFDTVSAFKILEKKVNPSFFKDKIVLVGATDPLIHDMQLTPFGFFPGVTIIANSLVMMLSDKFVHTLPPWQHLLLILVLGMAVIYLNKKLPFSFATIFTLLILLSLFMGFIYLRSLDIQFDYFSVFFMYFLSYVVSNTYKYSTLIFYSNKLKNLAVKDPLTGFYTPRYTILKLDEMLSDKYEDVLLLVIVISNYNWLVLNLSFEDVQSLTRYVARYIRSDVGKKFKAPLLCRLSSHIMGAVLLKEKKEVLESFAREFLHASRKVEIELGDKKVHVSFKTIVFHKPAGVIAHSDEVIESIGGRAGSAKEDNRQEFCAIEVEGKTWTGVKADSPSELGEFLLGDVEERIKELERMLREVVESKKETEEAYFQTILSLIKALEEKDTFTQGHSERVARYAAAIAKEAGLTQEECDSIYKAGLLHDIGKIGVPDFILHKQEKLSPEDIKTIKKHAIISVEILRPVKHFSKLLPIIQAHHERFDGTGYPHGLSGDMIPKGAQIMAVADAFDAITCGRGYKKGNSIAEAIQELERSSGTQLNLFYVGVLKDLVLSGALIF